MTTSRWIGVAALLLLLAFLLSGVLNSARSQFSNAASQPVATSPVMLPTTNAISQNPNSLITMLALTVPRDATDVGVLAQVMHPGLINQKEQPANPADARPLPILAPDADHVEVRQFNNADEISSIDALNGIAKVKLSGKLKTVNIASLDGEAVLDASDLQVQDINIGSVQGSAKLVVSATSQIRFTGTIGGGTKLEIYAPQGTVIIGNPESIAVDGGTQLNIHARNLFIRGTAAGGARINLTVTKGGKIHFDLLDGGAHLKYHKANPTDPDPTLEPGDIRAGGVFGIED